MKKDVCPVCGGGTLKKEVIKEKFLYKGASLTIPDYTVYRCDSCGEATVDKDTLKKSGKKLKEFQCKVDGMLSGEEVKKIRQKIGLTQEEMAEILGGGLKSFARYETSIVCQSRAMDNLLRILDAYPNVIQVVLKKKKRGKIEVKGNITAQERKVISLSEYRYANHPEYLYERKELSIREKDLAYGS